METNKNQQVRTSTIHSEGQRKCERTTVSSRSTCGKVSGGAGILKLSYEGENPMKNYFIASFIQVGRYALTLSVAIAIPECIRWGLRRYGILRGKEHETTQSSTGLPISSFPSSKPIEGTFAGDVARAIAKGKPKCLMAEEIIEGSRIILFSGTGVGKSLVVNQMAFSIASGKKSGLFPDEIETKPQNVLLIDTEQEDEDLYLRYCNGLSEIPENITRASNCQFNNPDELVSFIWEKVSKWTSNGTVIIDNITSAFSLHSPEKVRDFYSKLRTIQNDMRGREVIVTYILLCHETKSATKLSLKSLQGSGNLSNFATAVYGLECAGEELIKIKVLKNRRSRYNDSSYLEKLYNDPYLHFKFQEVIDTPNAQTDKTVISEKGSKSPEYQTTPRKCSEEQIEEMRRLYEEGMSIHQLHLQFGVNSNTVKKYLGLNH